MPLVVGENTYISLADAEAYFATRYNSALWDAQDDPTKEVLLQSATRSTDLYCVWSGEKTDEDQLLEFPRDDETEIPTSIETACCEIALAMVAADDVINSSDPSLKKMKADVIEFTFVDKFTSTNDLYNDFVGRLLSPYCSAASSGAKRLTRA